MEIVVGVSDVAVSSCAEDVLTTYSLGSCVGLALYDAEARVGGLLHSQLPVSTLAPHRAVEQPAMFTDTGVAVLLQSLFDLGASRSRLTATVAGASQSMDRQRLFRIGERNYTVLRKLLWKNDILITAEDVGGTASRTMILDMATGTTFIKSDGRTRVLRTTKEG